MPSRHRLFPSRIVRPERTIRTERQGEYLSKKSSGGGGASGPPSGPEAETAAGGDAKAARQADGINFDNPRHLDIVLRFYETFVLAKKDVVPDPEKGQMGKAAQINILQPQYSKLVSALKERYGPDRWLSRGLARQVVQAIRVARAAREQLARPLPDAREVVRVLCTPSVATSFVPLVVGTLIKENYFSHYAAHVVVTHRSEFAADVGLVGSGLATCLIDESHYSLAAADERRVVVHDLAGLFEAAPIGFTYSPASRELADGFGRVSAGATDTSGRPDFSFLAPFVVGTSHPSEVWGQVDDLLPAPSAGGGRVRFYTFNSLRAMLLRSDRFVALGAVPNDFSPWGAAGLPPSFFSFRDLPGHHPAAVELRDRAVGRFNLFLRAGWDTPRQGGAGHLTPAEYELVDVITATARDGPYVHPFTS